VNAPRRPSWLGTSIVVGVLYGVVGIVFALPSTDVKLWRLVAWVASAAVYAAHIAYESFALRNPSTSTALHVAVAVAIGGFALAVAAIIHSLMVPPNYSRWRFVLALVLWPIITAVPAFLVALVIAALLGSIFGRRLVA
jgi:hypothetical protein